MASSPPPPHRPLRGVRVLLVEDDRGPRFFVERTLAAEGAEIAVVGTVDEALQAFLANPPHLLITDLRLPGRGGRDLIDVIRTLPPERGGRVPILVFSGSIGEATEAGGGRGFQAMLPKPIDARTLLATVERLLGS